MRPPLGIALHRRADLAERLQHPIDVFAVATHPDVDHREGELLAEVRERGDRAVRKHLHGAFAVAQHDRPQVDLLDGPGHAVDARLSPTRT